jgi:hypothetical protein
MRTGFSCESQKEREQQGHKDMGGRRTLKWILEKQNGDVLTGVIWLMIGTSGRILLS